MGRKIKSREKTPKVISIAYEETLGGVRVMVLKSNDIVVISTYQDYSPERDNYKIMKGEFSLGVHSVACDFKRLPEKYRQKLEKKNE